MVKTDKMKKVEVLLLGKASQITLGSWPCKYYENLRPVWYPSVPPPK